MSHSIVLIGVWFGPWPIWIDFFLLSCAANREIDWLIFTDQTPPESTPGNVRVVRIELAEYRRLIRTALSVPVHDSISGYKLCDFRPALGHVHYDWIRAYDFFGFTDFDVIYGDIRSIYDHQTLSIYDALSTHSKQVSGHLFIMRNTGELRQAFKYIPDWKAAVRAEVPTGFDQQIFYLFFKSGRNLWY